MRLAATPTSSVHINTVHPHGERGVGQSSTTVELFASRILPENAYECKCESFDSPQLRSQLMMQRRAVAERGRARATVSCALR